MKNLNKKGERYCLYIDESGVPELSANNNYCILSGVLLNEKDERSFLFLIDRIKQKYNLDLHKHIHAVDIFERKNDESFLGTTVKRTKKDLRRQFQIDMWNIIKDYNVMHYTVTVPKGVVKRILLGKHYSVAEKWINSSYFYAKVDRQLPMDIGVNVIYHWAIKNIRNEDKLKIIFESRSGDIFTVRNFNYVQDKGVFKNKWMIAFSKKFKQKVVSVAFANKGVKSAGLELADIISYTSNLYYLQIKKGENAIDSVLRKIICFKGIHKTLNAKHYSELTKNGVKKYLPGLNSRTKRIANFYTRYSLSPANAGAQI